MGNGQMKKEMELKYGWMIKSLGEPINDECNLSCKPHQIQLTKKKQKNLEIQRKESQLFPKFFKKTTF
jgi:hypothetical protein